MTTRRAFARALAIAPLMAPPFSRAFAQDRDYPNRTVQLVVGFPAGQASDIGARLLAKAMAEDLKQAVYVDNKPGATGIIAHQFVKNASPDGYTVLFGSTATLAINPSLFRKLPYDPLKDFAPISLLWVSPMFLVVSPDLPVNTFAEAIAYVKANPGKTTYGSGGSGSTQHIAMELLKKELGLDMMHVPYKGTPGMLNDLIAGRVNFAFESASAIIPYIQAKSVKALATSVLSRLPIMPDLPTIAELGLPGFEAVTWAAFVAPAGTPTPVVARLNEAVSKALASKDMTDNFAKTHAQPRPGTPAVLEALRRKEISKWGKAVAAAGAQVD
jgi:tripartite-type tricarboxylate transporter receptor subunit TctC